MNTLTLDEMLGLMREIEAVDGIDFADLPFDEEHLRKYVLLSVMERESALSESSPGLDERVLIYQLSTAKLVLENLVLHARLLLAQGEPININVLMAKLRRPGPL